MAEEKKGLFQRLKEGLSKTHKNLVDKIDQVVIERKVIDEELYDELEEVLVSSDRNNSLHRFSHFGMQPKPS